MKNNVRGCWSWVGNAAKDAYTHHFFEMAVRSEVIDRLADVGDRGAGS